MSKQIQSEKTASHIRNTFIELLLQKDYSKITVKDISEAAGINRTTFYLFYDDKTALAKDTCAIFMDQFTQFMIPQMEEHSHELLAQSFEFVYKNKNIILGLWRIQESSFSPYFIMQGTFEEKLIQYYANEHHGTLTENQDYYCKLFSASAMTTIKWWLEQPEKISADVITDHVFTCIYKGLRSLLD